MSLQLKNKVALLASAVAIAALPAYAQVDLSLSVDSTPQKLDDGGLALTDDGGVYGFIPIGTKGAKYTFAVVNDGPDAATNIILQTALPETTAVARLVAADPDGGTVVSWSALSDGGGWSTDLEDGGTLKNPVANPVLFTALAAGESGTVEVILDWSPSALPTTCNTQFDLTATVAATEADSNTDDDSAMVHDVTIPIANITGTLEGPSGLHNPGDKVTLTGTVANAGPCPLSAGALTIDTETAVAYGYSLGFDEAGDCSVWTVTTGAGATTLCDYDGAIPVGSISLSTEQTLSGFDYPGGNSVIQSASTLAYDLLYDGNPALNDGDNLSPSVDVLVKGPASSCSMTGGPLSLLGLLGYGVLVRRRRKAKS